MHTNGSAVWKREDTIPIQFRRNVRSLVQLERITFMAVGFRPTAYFLSHETDTFLKNYTIFLFDNKVFCL